MADGCLIDRRRDTQRGIDVVPFPPHPLPQHPRHARGCQPITPRSTRQHTKHRHGHAGAAVGVASTTPALHTHAHTHTHHTCSGWARDPPLLSTSSTSSPTLYTSILSLYLSSPSTSPPLLPPPIALPQQIPGAHAEGMQVLRRCGGSPTKGAWGVIPPIYCHRLT